MFLQINIFKAKTCNYSYFRELEHKRFNSHENNENMEKIGVMVTSLTKLIQGVAENFLFLSIDVEIHKCV